MGKKLPYIKYLAWWLGLIKNCPKCKGKLIIAGNRGWKLYKCTILNVILGKTLYAIHRRFGSKEQDAFVST